MANSHEYGSFIITGLEIIPYASQSMELVPMEEVNESNSNKGVVEALPISFALPSKTIEVQSKEIVPGAMPLRSKLRSCETVNRVRRNFSPLEVFDFKELDEVEESIGHQTLLKFLEGWEIETRKRQNGTYDKFYHHDLSRKMLRSLAEVKRFIRKNTSAEEIHLQMNKSENRRVPLPMQFAPTKEVQESISNKDVVEGITLGVELPYEFAELQSREIVLRRPTQTRSRLRASETVNIVDKIFHPSEIFDVNELAMVEESICHQNSLIFLEHWEIETRKRKNGKYDKFYHHEKSDKMLRSLAEVKRFIRRNNYPEK